MYHSSPVAILLASVSFDYPHSIIDLMGAPSSAGRWYLLAPER